MKEILENSPFSFEGSSSEASEGSQAIDKSINPTFEYVIEATPSQVLSQFKDKDQPTWEQIETMA